MSPLGAALRAAARDPRGRAGLAFLALLLLVALLAPAVLPDPAAQPDPLGASNLAPSLLHPFGTDPLSRDLLARVVIGARVSLAVALLAVALSITLGALVGVAAGYLGGTVDTALMRLVDGALAIPRLFLLLLVLAVWERVPVADAGGVHRRDGMVRDQPIGPGRGAPHPGRELHPGRGGARRASAADYLPAPAAQRRWVRCWSRRRSAWVT